MSATRTKTPEPSDVGATVLRHLLGWPLYAFAAVGKRHYGFQWMLVAVYGIALFLGLVVTSN